MASIRLVRFLPSSQITSMQFDPDRPFGDIYKDSKALHDSIKEIIDIALVEAPSDESLKLRFITPRVYSDEWYHNDACTDYELTAPIDRVDYVSVSYCWTHPQSTDGLPPIPQYRVYDANNETLPPRPPRCPLLIFHHALVFARFNGLRYLWIDQECIDQTCTEDVESHLAIMDRVYSQSRFTVAMLSVTLKAAADVAALALVSDFERIRSLSNCKQLTAGSFDSQAMINALQFCQFDLWFTRTRTMHEQYCTQPGYLRPTMALHPSA